VCCSSGFFIYAQHKATGREWKGVSREPFELQSEACGPGK
jgi:hypothetical protein